MTDTDPGRPKRAFESSDVEGDDDAGDETRTLRPSRAWAPSEDDTEPAEPIQVTTPIPPPAPALPEALQPPEAGRRFSAEPPPADRAEVAPRRSAASVSSPPPPDAEADPQAADAGAPTETPEQSGRRRRALLIGAAAALLVLGLIIWLAVRGPANTATPPVDTSPTTSAAPSNPALDPATLLTPADMSGVAKGITWTEAPPAATGPVPQPACLELSTLGGPVPQVEANRQLTASTAGGTLTQVSLAMENPAAATTAYDTLLNALAGCQGALIVGGYTIDGLADAANALTFSLPGESQHTVLLTRTGKVVNIADSSVQADGPLSANALAAALGKSLTKQCQAAEGTCPTEPKAAAAAPPATETVGWLAWVDLPQVTAGVGKWTATDPQEPDLVGSQCEAVNLNKLSGAGSAAHRTYLLTEDTKAPQAFGIDEAVYVFGKPAQAKAMADTLKKNFASCASRTRTATVKNAAVSAVNADGDEVAGTTYLVSQKVGESKTVTFRVGVAAVGTRLVYLLANPAPGFDFSQAAWDAVLARAAQRASQFA